MYKKNLFPLVCLILLFFTFLVTSGPVWAARTINGKVVDRSGRPVIGVLIRAWDVNPGYGTNVEIGQGRTDSNGSFRIQYSNYTDPPDTFGGQTQPDIRVTVEPKSRGQYSVEAKTRDYKDHNPAFDLNVGTLHVDNDTLKQVRIGFDPQIHGFNFKNEPRSVCVVPTTCKKEHLLGGLFKEVASFKWALCGGMSLTAMKRYLAMRCDTYSSLNLTSAGKLPSALKEEIVTNQAQTLLSTRPRSLSLGLWFLEWQAKPDRGSQWALPSIGASTENEWEKMIKPELNKGLPVVIALIQKQASHPLDFDIVTENHQVLAIGYDENRFYNEVVIYAYDPNFPGDTIELRFNTKLRRSYLNPEKKVTSTGKTMPFRGLFMMNSSGLSGSPWENKMCFDGKALTLGEVAAIIHVAIE